MIIPLGARRVSAVCRCAAVMSFSRSPFEALVSRRAISRLTDLFALVGREVGDEIPMNDNSLEVLTSFEIMVQLSDIFETLAGA